MSCLKDQLTASAAIIALGLPCAAAQPAPDMQSIMEAMQQSGMPGMAPLPTQEGTWVYPVSAGLHEAMIGDRQIASGNGIDSDFFARASVHAAYVQAGDPPSCDNGSHADMRGRTRVVAMTVETGTGPFMGVEQRSRIVINQSLERAVIYLHGEVRSWVPGPNFCHDRQMVEDAGGRGMLRMDYATTAHVAPLNFMAFPRASEIDAADMQDTCEALRDLAFDAYQDMNRRWNTLNHSFDGPIDWSTFTPVPAGYGDGTQASFADGMLTSADVVAAAGQASDAISMGRQLGQIFARAPSLARGAGGAAGWAAVQAGNYLLGTAIGDPVDTMMQIAVAGDAAYRNSGAAPAQAAARHARMEIHHSGGTLHGLNADYLMHTVLEACEGLDPANMPAGSAAGHFSWQGGTVVLSGHGLAPGEPAATASGPVQSGSVADALALAQAMGAANLPDRAALDAMMPAGMSLDALPAPMSGRAGGGAMLASRAPEWTVNYTVELVDDGERIATLWFDPRR